MTQGLVLYDASARVVICNQRYIDMYGLSTDIVKPGCHFYDLIQHRKETGSYDGDVHEFCSNIMRNVAQGKVSSTVMEGGDGRAFMIVNKPLAQGGWVATIEDITERLNLEQERDRNQTFLREIIDHIPSQITVKDARDHRYLLANRVAEVQFGLSRDAIVGKTAFDLFSKPLAERIAADDDTGAAIPRRPVAGRAPLGKQAPGPPLHHLKAHRNPGSDRRPPLYHQRGRGCHRAATRGREDRAHGALRRAHRFAEPRAVPHPDRTRTCKDTAEASNSPCFMSTSTSSRASTICSGIMSATNC